MTTMQVHDIKRKKSVASRYAPNSYRIFDEGITNQSLPREQVYVHQQPQLYTQPFIVPAQSIESRNNPHAGRHAGFLRENVQSLNEPINQIHTRNEIESSDAKKWWEWNTPKDEMDSALKNKKRYSGIRVAENPNDINSYSTTYSKDMGYLNNVLEPGTKIGSASDAQRYAFNQNNKGAAVGIVPVNDLNTYSKVGEPQRVFVDKMSFEHGYDSRAENNYNLRGRRQGAFVIESQEPIQPVAFRSRPASNQNKGSSVWSAMHPNDEQNSDYNNSRQTSGVRKVAQSADKNDPNKRRDPIGYFNDERFGGSMGFGSNNNSRSGMRSDTQEVMGNQYQGVIRNEGPESYNPSWNNNGNQYLNDNGRFEDVNQNGDELLANAMDMNYPNTYPQDY